MKLTQLKQIVKETVKEAIQEELKDILLEAIKSPKNVIYETPKKNTTQNFNSTEVSSNHQPLKTEDRMVMRENIQQTLRDMMPHPGGKSSESVNVNTNSMPLQLNGSNDTTSPNGSLPAGEVSMDQIQSLMSKK